jgi:RNA polymerase sigma factor (sigma-70 family)
VDLPASPCEAVDMLPSDGVLLGQFTKDSDVASAAELVKRHEGDLLRVAHALLGNVHGAQDAVQEAFLTMCRQRHQLAANLHKDRGLGGWLCTVVRNHCLDQLRARAYRRHLDASTVDVPGHDSDPAHPTDTADKAQRIWTEVGGLPPLERAAIMLRYRDGMSYSEIAERLDKSATHIGVLLHSAIARMRSTGRLACLAPEGAP